MYLRSLKVQFKRGTACQCASENHTLLKGGDTAGKYFVGFADSLERLACYLCQIEKKQKQLWSSMCVYFCVCMYLLVLEGCIDNVGENAECSHLKENI